MIRANGTPLTPEKTDLILANLDVVWDIALNVPALDAEQWARKNGLPVSRHRLLLRHLDYLHDRGYRATIQINFLPRPEGRGLPRTGSICRRNGGASAGTLARHHGALSHRQQTRAEIIGCSHSATRRVRLRAHINARGKSFLCCDDFRMEYRFGSLLQHSVDEPWLSEHHIDAIPAARRSVPALPVPHRSAGRMKINTRACPWRRRSAPHHRESRAWPLRRPASRRL